MPLRVIGRKRSLDSKEQQRVAKALRKALGEDVEVSLPPPLLRSELKVSTSKQSVICMLQFFRVDPSVVVFGGMSATDACPHPPVHSMHGHTYQIVQSWRTFPLLLARRCPGKRRGFRPCSVIHASL